MEIKREFYRELQSIDYFSQCRKPVEGLYDFDVYVVEDMNSAIKSLSKTSWSNIVLEEQNRLTSYLFKNHFVEYNNGWNRQARINREELIPSILSKIEGKCCREIVDDTKYLLMEILMYHYYSEFGLESELLGQVLCIWKSGHLPCGYSGKYPHGKLRVI